MSVWTDSEGRSLGRWVEISHEELVELVEGAGGLEYLAVFSTCTDPTPYGRVYTAWGEYNANAPLVDMCDYKDGRAKTDHTVCRKFVRYLMPGGIPFPPDPNAPMGSTGGPF